MLQQSPDHSINSATPALRYIDITTARSIYGGSPAWWRKVVWQRRITSYRRGGRVVFAVADLDEYFAARRVPARTELT